MARKRIRSTKPDFWENECMGRKSMMARLTFLGLKDMADDAGRGRAGINYLWGQLHSEQPRSAKSRFKAALEELGVTLEFPPAEAQRGASEVLATVDRGASVVSATVDRGASVVSATVERGVSVLSAYYQRQCSGVWACATCKRPHVIFYKVDGCAYYWLPGFNKHQRIDKPTESDLPPPPISWNPREDSSLEVEGEKEMEKGGGGGKVQKTPPPKPSAQERTETAAPSAAAAPDEREVRKTALMFAFCTSPTLESKENAIRELLRTGKTHEFIRAVASKKEPKTFWQIIRSIEQGKAETVFKPSETKKITCKTCKDEGRILDREKTTVDRTAFQPCPSCKPKVPLPGAVP